MTSIVQKRQQEGAALLVVLWSSLLLAILLAGLTSRLRTEVFISRTQIDRLRAVEAMEGAAVVAAYKMTKSSRSETHLPFTYKLNEHQVRVTLSPQMRRLDLNLANEKELTDFFKSIGIDEQEALKLAARVLDWRDGDDFVRPNGAEKRDYRGVPPPRNRPFLSVDELALVLDMPEEVLTKHRDRLTLLGGYDKQMSGRKLVPGGRVTLKSHIPGRLKETPSFPSQTHTFRATGKATHPLEKLYQGRSVQ